MFDLIAKYYRMSLYTKENVAAFVVSGTITPEQYKEITGDEYVSNTPTYNELKEAVDILMGEGTTNE